jgi:hypothetical protein
MMPGSRLTLEEAAEELLAPSARWLNEWLLKHPRDKNGEPFYTPIGRAKRFHRSDITRIEVALRGELQCRSGSGRRVKAKRQITKSGGRTSDSELRLAAELTNDPSLLERFGTSKSASNSTGNTQRLRQSLTQGNQHS